MAGQGPPVREYGQLKPVDFTDTILFKSRSPSEAKPTRVLLVADAQLRDPSTVSTLKSWFGYDSNTAYLRKSWRVASRLRPNIVMFLGDTFASGRYVTSEAECVSHSIDVSVGYWRAILTMRNRYDQYCRAFETTFPRDASMPFYLIPGNNDIGCVSVLANNSGSKCMPTG